MSFEELPRVAPERSASTAVAVQSTSTTPRRSESNLILGENVIRGASMLQVVDQFFRQPWPMGAHRPARFGLSGSDEAVVRVIKGVSPAIAMVSFPLSSDVEVTFRTPEGSTHASEQDISLLYLPEETRAHGRVWHERPRGVQRTDFILEEGGEVVVFGGNLRVEKGKPAELDGWIGRERVNKENPSAELGGTGIAVYHMGR